MVRVKFNSLARFINFSFLSFQFSAMDEFFAANGTRKLMFFYQEGLVSLNGVFSHVIVFLQLERK